MTTNELLSQAQQVEQSLHAHTAQRNALQQQQSEIEHALSQLEKTNESYQILGNIMIKTTPADLQKELQGKKEILTTRLASVQRQEDRLREELQNLQQQILKR